MRAGVLIGIAIVAGIVIYCMITEDENDKREDKFCKRKDEPEAFELELVQGSTNVYARKW